MEIKIVLPDNIMAVLGEHPEKVILRALLERLLIRRLLREEKIEPEPDAEEEIRAVLEIDRRVKKALWRKFYGQR